MFDVIGPRAGTQSGESTAWTYTWTPGANLANFFALYDYHPLADANGDFTSTGAFSIATTLDGPIQVAKFRNLVANHAGTASQRCRGIMPIADSLSMGAGGSISMTGMGAKGASNWAVGRDIFVPQSITFTGKNTSLKQFLDWIRSTGYCIFDPTMYACPPPGMGDVTCDWATWTPYGAALISAAGCGQAVAAGGQGAAGLTGNAGTNAPGGGGSGGAAAGNNAAMSSAPGNTWGGGCGSGGAAITYSPLPDISADKYGGRGGLPHGTGTAGAGNPAGDGSVSGTGGILLAIIRGAVTLAAGHAFSANGVQAPPATGGPAGGGSGGGKCGIYYGGALTGTFNQTASGGASRTGAAAGGAGGTGHSENKTFGVMGW